MKKIIFSLMLLLLSFNIFAEDRMGFRWLSYPTMHSGNSSKVVIFEAYTPQELTNYINKKFYGRDILSIQYTVYTNSMGDIIYSCFLVYI